MTKVVNIRADKYDVYIGRGSKWGNPFKIGIDGTREEVIEKYIQYFWTTNLFDDIEELVNKILGCYCSPKDCHGDFLAYLANNLELVREIRSFSCNELNDNTRKEILLNGWKNE